MRYSITDDGFEYKGVLNVTGSFTSMTQVGDELWVYSDIRHVSNKTSFGTTWSNEVYYENTSVYSLNAMTLTRSDREQKVRVI